MPISVRVRWLQLMAKLAQAQDIGSL